MVFEQKFAFVIGEGYAYLVLYFHNNTEGNKSGSANRKS